MNPMPTRSAGPASLAFAAGLACVLALLPAPARGQVDWPIDLELADAGEALPTALLGHYDLSGQLLAYDQEPGLVEAMTVVGFSDWRVGVGRWEASTWLLPSLSDGTPCFAPIPGSAAPGGWDDLALIAARDWFIDDGAPVMLADTRDDARYALGYLRGVLDVVDAFGATPFVSIDSMPRALAVSQTPLRTDCQWSFQNRVTNVRPQDAAVFGAAVAGLVERVVEGSDGQPARAVTHWEIWNEPEFAPFWDKSFEDGTGGLDRYFEMAVEALFALDAYRAGSTHPNAQGLAFGLGSFGTVPVAVATLQGFDAAAVPSGFVPIDFLSFHAYSDDPLEVVAAIDQVATAAAATAHYADIELALAEWGPDLATSAGDPVYAASIEPALHVATVLSLGAYAGLDRAHRAIFWDFFPSSIRLGLLDHDRNPRSAYRAYELLSRVIVEEAERLSPAGLADGRLDGGLGAVLAGRDAAGVVRVLLTNRNAEARTARVRLGGTVRIPSRILVFADPVAPIEEAVGSASEVIVPGASLVLLEFEPAAVPSANGLVRGLVGVLLGAVASGVLGSRPRSQRKRRRSAVVWIVVARALRLAGASVETARER